MKRALIELATNRVAQVVEAADEFPVAGGLIWADCADDATPLTHFWDGVAVVPNPPAPPPPPPPSAEELEAEAVAALNGAGPVDLIKLFRAKMISDLAFRLGVLPGALTLAQRAAERDRIAAIYKAL